MEGNWADHNPVNDDDNDDDDDDVSTVQGFDLERDSGSSPHSPDEGGYGQIGGGVAARFRELERDNQGEVKMGQTRETELATTHSPALTGDIIQGSRLADGEDVDGLVADVGRAGSPIGSLLSATGDTRSIQVVLVLGPRRRTC